MTETESSKQMKDRNSHIADANFVMAGGSEFFENSIKTNPIVMKSTFENHARDAGIFTGTSPG
jgi:hypothetical protein